MLLLHKHKCQKCMWEIFGNHIFHSNEHQVKWYPTEKCSCSWLEMWQTMTRMNKDLLRMLFV